MTCRAVTARVGRAPSHVQYLRWTLPRTATEGVESPAIRKKYVFPLCPPIACFLKMCVPSNPPFLVHNAVSFRTCTASRAHPPSQDAEPAESPPTPDPPGPPTPPGSPAPFPREDAVRAVLHSSGLGVQLPSTTLPCLSPTHAAEWLEVQISWWLRVFHHVGNHGGSHSFPLPEGRRAVSGPG